MITDDICGMELLTERHEFRLLVLVSGKTTQLTDMSKHKEILTLLWGGRYTGAADKTTLRKDITNTKLSAVRVFSEKALLASDVHQI